MSQLSVPKMYVKVTLYVDFYKIRRKDKRWLRIKWHLLHETKI